jgi:hypothetical protein
VIPDEELKDDPNLRELMDDWNAMEEVKVASGGKRDALFKESKRKANKNTTVIVDPMQPLAIDDEAGHTPRNKKSKKKRASKNPRAGNVSALLPSKQKLPPIVPPLGDLQ